MKIAVIGAGSWGTALAQQLAINGHDVCIWARKESVVEGINAKHCNPRYFADFTLHERISASSSYAHALDGADAVVVVTPSTILRDTAFEIKPYIGEDTPIVICSKGVEEQSGMVPVELFTQVLGNEERMAVLSGPNHAEEVILGLPSATVIASSHAQIAEFFQTLFASRTFRAYVSDDVMGVELCAAFKNVIAIAVGISYGLGFGDNTAAMIQTRGIAEMSRLISACGGNSLTCMGLAGTGDLIVTCMSEHSRNRRFGKMLAQGKTLDDFTAETHMVAEGCYACRSLAKLAELKEVELPITRLIRDIIWFDTPLSVATDVLMSRPLNKEFY